MYTFDCFTDRRPRPTSPRRTPREQAAIAEQRPLLGSPNESRHHAADVEAAREWLAHVDAGRIGGGVR